LTASTPPFKKALVRTPASTFAEGLTSANLGAPDYSLALVQFNSYCSALSDCGLEVITLLADDRYPDSTFVEDTAVVTDQCLILTRPGALVRRGEVAAIAPAITELRFEVREIKSPGTLEGGDICQAGTHFFIGLSERTNHEGAQQLSNHLTEFGFTSSFVDIRNNDEMLHLKSGVAYLGDGRMVISESLKADQNFKSFELIHASSLETYACNCISVNGRVLIASGFPVLKEKLDQLGYLTIELDVSEFRKMDGGLSCLSIRF
jgi:dimethylargininase